MDIEKFRQDYPEMPDFIRDRIVMEVDEQKGVGKHKKSFAKAALIPFAACFVFLCGIATFAKSDLLREWLSGLGPNAEEAEKLVQTDVAKSEDDWLTVKDVYIDGMRLVFVARLSENAQELPVDISDHSMVGGIDCLSDEFTPLGNGLYEGRIILSKELLESELPEMMDVTVKLYINDNSAGADRREFSFEVPSENLYLTTQIESDRIQIFETGENGEQECIGTVVGKFAISPSTVMMTLHYEFTGEHAKENREKYCDSALDYDLMDDSGNRSNISDVMSSLGYENDVEEENFSSLDMVAELHKFDYQSKTITIVPISMDYYTEGELAGKHIEGTEVLHEDRAITIPLQ